MKILAYIRVSTGHQVESGHGLSAQKSACTKWAQDNNHKIEKFFEDEGISGSTGFEKRPALFDLLNCLKKGDTLLVATWDRIGREEGAVFAIESTVNKKGAKIVSVLGEGTESKDEISAFIGKKMAKLLAEYQRMMTITNTKAALAAKRDRGEQTGHLMKGFKLAADGLHLEEDEEEQRIFRIIKRYREFRYTYKEIAKILNDDKILNRHGRLWTGWTVRYNHKVCVIHTKPLPKTLAHLSQQLSSHPCTQHGTGQLSQSP